MLDAIGLIAAYYLAVGFLILLVWMGFASDLITATAAVTNRATRWGRIALALGVFHPGFALAGRDLVRQSRLADGQSDAQLPSCWGWLALSGVGALGAVGSVL